MTRSDANGAVCRYSRPHQFIHWLTAGLVLAVLVLAWWMMNIDHSFLRARLLWIHKSVGLTILGLTILRTIWRIFSPPPPLPGRIGMVQKGLAHLTHICLYLVLLAMPISGYLTSVWGSAPVSFFGLFTLPEMVEPDDDLADRAFAVHALVQWAVYAFLSLHILGALFHWLVRRDGIASRMGLGSPVDHVADAQSRY